MKGKLTNSKKKKNKQSLMNFIVEKVFHLIFQ